ncbi:MAG: arginine--tRNA ligase [Parcubacteria group bacterium]
MKEEIEKILKETIETLKNRENWPDFETFEIAVDYPKNEVFGDFTTNVAMSLGRLAKKNPLEVANALSLVIGQQSLTKAIFDKVEVVAPGYLNFYLSKKYLQDKVAEINEQQEKFGDNNIGQGIKINNEFISANPTGPLHLGNGRGGFYGDSVSKILKKSGFEVTNEYYVNDAGEQVVKLGHSVLKDSEAVYGGEYIDELNKRLESKTKDPIAIGVLATHIILEEYIKKTVQEKMKIEFDSWISESIDLGAKNFGGYVDKAVEILNEKGLTFEEEGALWLKTTKFGDDKDRVLQKSNRQKTYFASDCGYLLNKKERNFDNLIEIWGADHHGYVNRFRAAAQALGFKKEQVRFIIVQLVKLVKNGKEVRMSKRAGNVVYIDDLIEKVGHDVTRFFFLMYSPDTHMNFDLGLAEEHSEKNPVFHVQYAHARICSILGKAADLGINAEKADLTKLVHEKELLLVRELDKFPALVAEVAQSYEVHKLPYYAIRLADKFHSFYNDLKVIDADDPELTAARLKLIAATKIVLREVLRLIGVSSPDRM